MDVRSAIFKIEGVDTEGMDEAKKSALLEEILTMSENRFGRQRTHSCARSCSASTSTAWSTPRGQRTRMAASPEKASAASELGFRA